VGTLHPSSCGRRVKTRSVVLLLTSSETMSVLTGIPAQPVQLNLLEMSWFITAPVGFNYCFHGVDICSLSLPGCKGIRKCIRAHTHSPPTPLPHIPHFCTAFNTFPSMHRKPMQVIWQTGLDLQIQLHFRDP